MSKLVQPLEVPVSPPAARARGGGGARGGASAPPLTRASFLGVERTFDSIEGCSDVLRFCVAHAGRVHAFFVRAARQNSGNFAILSRDFGPKFA